LRQQALTWLRADLGAWTKRLDSDRRTVEEALRHWQTEDALSGVRHPWSLLRFPDEERRQWQKLWTEVNELLRQASRTGM
jgi:hypothetical protein